MPSIEGRLIALSNALQRRALIQSEPVDGLSQSLFDFQREVGALDNEGKAALLEAMNRTDADGTAGLDITPSALEKMIFDFTR